jgi:hypothetical protein
MVTVPGLTPVSTPVVPPIVATPLVLDHVPPPVASVSVIEEPAHTLPGLAMEAGSELTVIGKTT